MNFIRGAKVIILLRLLLVLEKREYMTQSGLVRIGFDNRKITKSSIAK